MVNEPYNPLEDPENNEETLIVAPPDMVERIKAARRARTNAARRTTEMPALPPPAAEPLDTIGGRSDDQ